MSKYVCQNCGSAMQIRYGTVTVEEKRLVPDKDGSLREKYVPVDYRGLGSWSCPRGCRAMRRSTNKGKSMQDRNQQKWSFSPVATSPKATCKRVDKRKAQEEAA